MFKPDTKFKDLLDNPKDKSDSTYKNSIYKISYKNLSNTLDKNPIKRDLENI